MADARTELALYVAGGNMRESNTPETHIAIQKERLALLGSRLGRWRETMGQTIVTPESAPADFQAALDAADERAYQRSLSEQGRDIPRLDPQNPTAAKVTNAIYKAHDTVAALPHPGGLALLILLIAGLWLVLIPATGKGETRLLLLWDVLLGRKQMPGTAPAPATTDQQDIQTSANAAATGVAAGLSAATGGTINLAPADVIAATQGIIAGLGLDGL